MSSPLKIYYSAMQSGAVVDPLRSSFFNYPIALALLFSSLQLIPLPFISSALLRLSLPRFHFSSIVIAEFNSAPTWRVLEPP
jgi:hypothetical protein